MIYRDRLREGSEQSFPAVHAFDAGKIVRRITKAVLKERVYEVSRRETSFGLANLQDQHPRTIIESGRSAERCCVETLHGRRL